MDQRILVVDQDAEIRANLLCSLVQEGNSVFTCADGESALMLLESAKANEIFYDAVVLGASLADYDTIRLASEIRNKYPYASLMCITGPGREEIDGTILDGPNTRIIEQPFEMRELLVLLDELINGKTCCSGRAD